MAFQRKSIDEVGCWLREELGLSDKIVDIFKGMPTIVGQLHQVCLLH